MNVAKRLFQVFVGLVLLVTGAGIIYAFHAHGWTRGHDSWDGGFLLLAEAYSIVGSLFILLGLRYAVGPQSCIGRRIASSRRNFAGVFVLLSFAILAAMVFSWR
jgi:hypothetical protein